MQAEKIVNIIYRVYSITKVKRRDIFVVFSLISPIKTNRFVLPQVKCPTQIILQATMNLGARSMVGITRSHQRTASLATGVRIQASPLPPTPRIQIPSCILGGRGAFLEVHTQGSPTPAGDPATPTRLQCLLWFHPPYRQTS